MPFLSIVVTTSGEEQLYYAVLSLKDQMRPMDELIVVGNGPQPRARKIVLGTIGNRPNIWYIETNHSLDNGNSQRQFGMNRARGVRLFFMDEKDLITWGALDTIRDAAMVWDQDPLLLLSRNIGGATKTDVLVPYNDKLGDWAKGSFVDQIVHNQGEPVLVNEVVLLVGAEIC